MIGVEAMLANVDAGQPAAGEMEPRAGLRPGCAARVEPGDPDRQPAAAGAGVPCRFPTTTGRNRRRPVSNTWPRARSAAPRCRRRHCWPNSASACRARATRCWCSVRTSTGRMPTAWPCNWRRSCGCRPGSRRRPRAVRSHPPCLLPRRAAGGHRRDQPAAGRPRPDPGRRAGVPLSPVRPRRLPAGRRRAGAGHLRSRRSSTGADGRRVGRRHRADPRGTARTGPPQCAAVARRCLRPPALAEEGGPLRRKPCST